MELFGDFLGKVEVQLHFELRVRVWQEHRGREKNGNLKRGECFAKIWRVREFMAYSGMGRRAGSRE